MNLKKHMALLLAFFLLVSNSGMALNVHYCGGQIASVSTVFSKEEVCEGATAAKYIRMWSEQSIRVTLIEPNADFVSCPISNLVLGGSKTMADITVSYGNLAKRHGVNVVRDMVSGIDADRRTVKLASGGELGYDRLILSPGIDFMWETLPGMNKPGAQEKVLHAWKAGPQTVALRKQLEAMPDGGVYALTIPLAPYRCPPGPYERACQVASYFSKAKPKSKVIIFDANDDVTSKGPLFKKAWAARYKMKQFNLLLNPSPELAGNFSRAASLLAGHDDRLSSAMERLARCAQTGHTKPQPMVRPRFGDLIAKGRATLA